MGKILKDKLSKTLFHGTLMDRAENILKNGIDFSLLNDKADFAKGFYVTDSYALAENTAKTRYVQEKMSNKGIASPPVVIRFTVNLLNYKYELKIKEFYGDTKEWRKFVCVNRWYDKLLKINPEYDNNTDKRYDIVIGLTADGKMSNINKLMRQDKYNLSDEFLKNVNPIIHSYPKHTNGKIINVKTKSYQISFHNEEFVKSCIKYKSYDIIRLEERR